MRVLKRWNLDKSALTDSDLAALYAFSKPQNAPAAPAARMSCLSGSARWKARFYDDELKPCGYRCSTGCAAREQALRDSPTQTGQIVDGTVLGRRRV